MNKRQTRKNESKKLKISSPTANRNLAELILSEICKNLANSKLKLTNTSLSKDGRVNSSLLESIVNEHISTDLTISKLLKKYKLKLIIPSEREWYDLCISSKDLRIFIPINIKISSLKTADNVSSKKGLYYACTGVIPQNKDYEFDDNYDGLKSNKWSEFYLKLKRDIDKNEDADYYFLILNKNDNSDVFFNSLKSLQTVVPNGNNLPFLCNWNNNRLRIKRSHVESRKYLLSVFLDSINLAYESIVLGKDVLNELI